MSSPVRLTSLDTFRGLTVAAMILVNNPGSWKTIWPPLRHASWHGCTPTDLIFPFFLFIVGVSMAMNHGKRDAVAAVNPDVGSSALHRLAIVLPRILARAATLVALGLLLNWFGKWGFVDLRLPGVLQRIGLCYFLAAIVTEIFPRRWQWGIPLLLIAHAAVLLLIRPEPIDPTWSATLAESANLQKLIDDAVFSPAHLYRGSKTDPEGLLGTLTALATVLIGFWCGGVIRHAVKTGAQPSAIPRLLVGGLCALVAGYATAGFPVPSGDSGWFTTSPSWAMPLNKPLWTASYTLFTAGLGAISLAVLFRMLDVASSSPNSFRQFAVNSLDGARAIGRNAMFVFVGSGLLARVLAMIPAPIAIETAGKAAQRTDLKTWMFESGLSPVFGPVLASLVFALGNVALWVLIAIALDRRKLYWRV